MAERLLLGRHFEWRVPVDDENMLSVAWFFVRVPRGREPYVQQSVPTWKSPIRDETAAGSPAMSSTRTSSPGSGRAPSPTAPARTCVERRRHQHDAAAFFEELDAIKAGRDPWA